MSSSTELRLTLSAIDNASKVINGTKNAVVNYEAALANWVRQSRASTQAEQDNLRVIRSMTEAEKSAALAASDLANKTERMGKMMGAGKDFAAGLGIPIDALSNPAMAAGQAIKFLAEQTWEMGKQGAVVIQTAESFDFLMDKVNATPGVLDRLRAASLGTVDDMTLMSATATLLAGTSGDLAKMLADSTPELLEIAKAAQKLNPSLGDTAFLYESIATGIKRNSPMILDNLGITIKVGKANETYAKVLGKTVEQLTSEETAQALLNAVLESGNTLIEQAGGNAESATDSFQRLDATLKNYKDTIARSATPATAELADTLSNVVTRETLYREAIEKGMVAKWEQLNPLRAFVLTQEELNERLAEYDAWLDGLRGPEGERAHTTLPHTIEATDGLAVSTDKAAGSTERLASGMWESAEAGDEVVTTVQEMIKENQRYFDELNPNIESTFKTWLEKIEWVKAGGGEIQAQFDLVKASVDNGSQSLTQAQREVELLYIKAETLKVTMGDITAEEAAQNIRDTLGLSLEEALQLVLAIRQNAEFDVTSYVHIITTEERKANYAGWTAPEPRASGGPVNPGRNYIVGEEGPELLTMDSSGGGTITPITNNNYFNLNMTSNAPVSTVTRDFGLMQSMVSAR